MGVKGIEAITDKRYPSYNIANTIRGKNPRALKYSSNTPKDRDNRSKRLALLGKCSSR